MGVYFSMPYEVELLQLDMNPNGTYSAELLGKAVYTDGGLEGSLLLVNQHCVVSACYMSEDNFIKILVLCTNESWELNIMLVCFFYSIIEYQVFLMTHCFNCLA